VLDTDEEKRIKVELTQTITKGSISISGQPRGAYVSLDGSYVGKLPIKLRDIEQGRHEVEVSSDGFEMTKKRVNLVAGEDKKLHVRLIQAGPREIARDGRFIAYETGLVKDTSTGLEWVAGPDKNTDWNEAKRWVARLNVDGGGWRMPTRAKQKFLKKKILIAE